MEQADILEAQAKMDKRKKFAVSQKVLNAKDIVAIFHKSSPYFYDKDRSYWLWNEERSCWERVDETDIFNALDKLVERFFPVETSQTIYDKNHYLEILRRHGRNKKPKEAPKTWIQFKNKVVDIKTGEVTSPSPEYYLTNPIPWSCSKKNKTPILDKYFSEWVGKDKVKLLKEIIAFSMVNEYFIHAIFFLIGGGRNGKTTFLKILRNVLGSKNCCSTELDFLMKTRFETSKLYRKQACIMGETDFNTLSSTKLLKNLSGQDPVSFEFKRQDAFTDVNYAKLFIATNGLPKTVDTTDGFYRRTYIIEFPNEFPENVDIMGSIPEEEYEALCSQCLEIATNLWKVREFCCHETIEERRRKYEEHSNPLKIFIERYCTEDDPDSYIAKWKFMQEFKVFCKENKYRTWSETEVGLYMNDTLKIKTKKKIFVENGEEKRWNAYMGLKFVKEKRSVTSVPSVKYPLTCFSPLLESSIVPLDSIGTLDIASEEVEFKHLSCQGYFPTLDIIKALEKEPNKSQYIETLIFAFGEKTEQAIEELKQKGVIMESKPGLVMLI